MIEAELAKLAEQLSRDWRARPGLAEIIDHIIVRGHHDRHREQLPELILQATKVERVHADKPNVPKGLTKYLTMLHQELSSHMMKEEQILFPMIKQGMGNCYGLSQPGADQRDGKRANPGTGGPRKELMKRVNC